MLRPLCCSALLFATFAPALVAVESRPFPQHTIYAAGSIRPARVAQAALDEATRSFYRSWKTTYLATPGTPGELVVLDDEDAEKGRPCTTSEGHGYGMLIAVLMAGADPEAQAEFDALFRYFRNHPSSNNPHLMAWRQELHDGKADTKNDDSATDGDLDIAYALLLADAQWGSAGRIAYRAEARQLIAAIKKDEINPAGWSVKLGDWSGDEEPKYFFSTRPSDFMATHFRAFGAATADRDWAKVTETCYRLVATMQTSFSPATGLLPDFIAAVDVAPTPPAGKFLEGKHDGMYYYNSCRVPLRLGLDFLLNGDLRARTALDKINTWIKTEAAGQPANVVAGYQLDGRPAQKSDRSLAFTACLGVGAMTGPEHQQWLDDLWDYTVATDSPEDRYFARTLKMLSLIAMSGNWWTVPAAR